VLLQRVDLELWPGGLGMETATRHAERVEAEARADRIEDAAEIDDAEAAAETETHDIDGRDEEVEARRLHRHIGGHAARFERVGATHELGALRSRQDLADMLGEGGDPRAESVDLRLNIEGGVGAQEPGSRSIEKPLGGN